MMDRVVQAVFINEKLKPRRFGHSFAPNGIVDRADVAPRAKGLFTGTSENDGCYSVFVAAEFEYLRQSHNHFMRKRVQRSRPVESDDTYSIDYLEADLRLLLNIVSFTHSVLQTSLHMATTIANCSRQMVSSEGRRCVHDCGLRFAETARALGYGIIRPGMLESDWVCGPRNSTAINGSKCPRPFSSALRVLADRSAPRVRESVTVDTTLVPTCQERTAAL
jgi:hypothetical protein